MKNYHPLKIMSNKEVAEMCGRSLSWAQKKTLEFKTHYNKRAILYKDMEQFLSFIIIITENLS